MVEHRRKRRRISDEMLLDWVRRRASGEATRTIAPERYEQCRDLTNDVRRQDVLLSGEPEGRVRMAYWD